jgi:N-acetylmuramoyl-L-alanine amidase
VDKAGFLLCRFLSSFKLQLKKEGSMVTKKWIAGALCVMLMLSILGVATAQRLQYGDAGPTVLALQQRLRLLSFYDDVLDGKYGYKTYLAVKKFQESVGLQADGIAGPKTLEKLGYSAPSLSGKAFKRNRRF